MRVLPVLGQSGLASRTPSAEVALVSSFNRARESIVLGFGSRQTRLKIEAGIITPFPSRIAVLDQERLINYLRREGQESAASEGENLETAEQRRQRCTARVWKSPGTRHMVAVDRPDQSRGQGPDVIDTGDDGAEGGDDISGERVKVAEARVVRDEMQTMLEG